MLAGVAMPCCAVGWSGSSGGVHRGTRTSRACGRMQARVASKWLLVLPPTVVRAGRHRSVHSASCQRSNRTTGNKPDEVASDLPDDTGENLREADAGNDSADDPEQGELEISRSG
jgi:hypothetical protein